MSVKTYLSPPKLKLIKDIKVKKLKILCKQTVEWWSRRGGARRGPTAARGCRVCC